MSGTANNQQSNQFELREPAQFDDEKFVLSEEQIKKLNAWAIDVEQRAAAIQAEQIKQKIKFYSEGGEVDEMISNHYKTYFSRYALPHYGTIGGGYSFTFTPTGIGGACTVTESITGESIDLTDYDGW